MSEPLTPERRAELWAERLRLMIVGQLKLDEVRITAGQSEFIKAQLLNGLTCFGAEAVDAQRERDAKTCDQLTAARFQIRGPCDAEGMGCERCADAIREGEPT